MDHNEPITLWSQRLSEFRDSTASTAPTPGGGSVTAVGAVLGVALIRMAVEITAKKNDSPALQQLLTQLKDISEKLSGYADKDIAVFNEYMAALKLPKTTEEEILARKKALAQAVLAATNCPVETAGLMVDAMKLAKENIATIKKDVISDVGAGVALLQGALTGVLFNVDINLPSISSPDDRAFFSNKKQTLKEEAESLSKEVLAATETLLTVKK